MKRRVLENRSFGEGASRRSALTKKGGPEPAFIRWYVTLSTKGPRRGWHFLSKIKIRASFKIRVNRSTHSTCASPSATLDPALEARRQATRDAARRRREYGGKKAGGRINLEADSLGLEPLQALEIPQNGQSFVWKCLDENTPDLEKLAISLEVCLDSAAFARRRIVGRGPRGRNLAPAAPAEHRPTAGYRTTWMTGTSPVMTENAGGRPLTIPRCSASISTARPAAGPRPSGSVRSRSGPACG